MVMVGSDRAEVERSLVSGELSCPSCQGVLAPWGHARARSSRGPGGTVRHRPRRARCTGCRGTHVLLAQVWLWRRADAVSVLGAALEAKAAGAGHRSIATGLGRPATTVRGHVVYVSQRYSIGPNRESNATSTAGEARCARARRPVPSRRSSLGAASRPITNSPDPSVRTSDARSSRVAARVARKTFVRRPDARSHARDDRGR